MNKSIVTFIISISSVFVVNAQWTGTNPLLTSANVGIGTTNPKEKLQIGDFNNTQNLKLSLPGVYNFEEIKLGQYGNGSCGLEFINHTYLLQSYGVRLYSNVDNGITGLQIQTASPMGGYNDLSYVTRLAVHTNGNVGIGTITPQYKLDVCRTIRANEVKVEITSGCDFVFDKGYELMDLQKLEKFIDTNKHLPQIASEKEMVENGVEMKDLQMKLLMKIEELTLYTINQNKKIEQQSEELQALRVKLEKLETR